MKNGLFQNKIHAGTFYFPIGLKCRALVFSHKNLLTNWLTFRAIESFFKFGDKNFSYYIKLRGKHSVHLVCKMQFYYHSVL